jgi:hypothetical protein
VTVNVWPPTEIVAVRGVEFGFVEVLNVTVPLPAPDGVPVTVSHAALLVAVQEQPPPAVTANDPVAAVDGTDWLAGEIA